MSWLAMDVFPLSLLKNSTRETHNDDNANSELWDLYVTFNTKFSGVCTTVVRIITNYKQQKLGMFPGKPRSTKSGQTNMKLYLPFPFE